MYRIGILLLGMASMAAGGILIDRNRVVLHPYHGLVLRGEQSLDRPDILSRDELLRQKFILDILEQINLPLQNEELLRLGDGDVTNENLYKQPLDEDMLYVLDLIRHNEMLGTNVACSINNDLHVRQMVGLYKLLLNAQDFEILQRLVVYARRNVNTELFVNSLILALGQRSDTNMLAIPALYEILPQLYHDSDLIEEIRKIREENLLTSSAGVSSTRPNLLDVMTLGRQNRPWNTNLPESRGMWDILHRSELWMPWRRLHQELAVRKALGGRTLQQDDRTVDKVVISLPVRSIQNKPLGLFTEDLSLKSYLNMLIDELVVRQGSNRKIERDQLEIHNIEDEDILGERRYLNNRNEYTTNTMDRDILSQRREDVESFSNTDRLISVGRRLRTQNDLDDENLNSERPLEASREMHAIETERDENINDRIPYAGRRLRNRVPIHLNTERRITTNQAQDRNILSGRKEDVSLNDHRLLFVGRRRKNLNESVSRNDLDIGNIFEDDISGGRHVSRDERRDRNGRRDERRENSDDESRHSHRRQDTSDSHRSDQDQEQKRMWNERRNEGDRWETNRDQEQKRMWNERRNEGDSWSSNRDQEQKRMWNERRNEGDRWETNRDQEQKRMWNERRNEGDRWETNRDQEQPRMWNERRNEGDSWASNRDQEQQRMSNERRNEGDSWTSNRDQEEPHMWNERRNEGESWASNRDQEQKRVWIERRNEQQESTSKRINDNMDRGLYYRRLYGRKGLENGREGDIGINQENNRNQPNYWRNREDSLQKSVGLGTELPTVAINDERLLHINRRKLNEVQEGRRVGILGDDENKRKMSLIDRSRLMEEDEGNRKYVDRDGDSIRRSTINDEEEGDRKYIDRDDDDDNIGRRENDNEEAVRWYVKRDDSNMGRRNLLNIRERDEEEDDRDNDRIRGGNILNKRNNNEDEGEWKYVDRDDDRIRGGNMLNRRDRSIEEGNRKYVDRDDDRIHGSNILNRRRLNEQEGDRKYLDRDDDRMLGGNRRRLNEDEGNRKYVDRDDDDSMREDNLLNRRGRSTEEGDRKYVDRDDDSMRGGNLLNRRRHNDEEGNRKYVTRDDDIIHEGNESDRERDDDRIRDRLALRKNYLSGIPDPHLHRSRRSLGNERTLDGELLIHNLQQLAARINIELISLGEIKQIDDYMQQGNRILTDSNGWMLNRHDNRQDPLVLEKINSISRRLEMALQENIPRLSVLTIKKQIHEIGLLLADHLSDLGLLDILSQAFGPDNREQEGQLQNILQQREHQLILCRIMDIIDSHIKKLDDDRDILLQGVTINNIQVDRLQTFVEYSDVDLTNLLSINIDHSDTNNKKLVVGRIPQLNHKSFNIKLDIDADNRRQVIIRTFLGPKTDGRGNIESLREQRQNYILLDINTVDLKKGRNNISLKSRDIAWTSRDTTTCSEIYERVMRALDGDIVLTKDVLIGQSNLFPQRLLLPRGRIDGLPMQLLTVITPIEQAIGLDYNLKGLDALQVDRLPINYPLNSDIQDVNTLISMPNVFLKDVTIYHEANIKHSYLL